MSDGWDIVDIGDFCDGVSDGVFSLLSTQPTASSHQRKPPISPFTYIVVTLIVVFILWQASL